MTLCHGAIKATQPAAGLTVAASHLRGLGKLSHFCRGQRQDEHTACTVEHSTTTSADETKRCIQCTMTVAGRQLTSRPARSWGCQRPTTCTAHTSTQVREMGFDLLAIQLCQCSPAVAFPARFSSYLNARSRCSDFNQELSHTRRCNIQACPRPLAGLLVTAHPAGV